MDPNACADRYFTAWNSDDYSEMSASISDLTEWRNRGGFMTPRSLAALRHDALVLSREPGSAAAARQINRSWKAGEL